MPTIYTLGYTACNPDDLRSFAHARSTVVIDTRMAPRSRAPQWDGDALKQLLGVSNYQHERWLGNRNYKSVKSAIAIVNLKGGLVGPKALLDVGMSVLLLCACVEHRTCHRFIIAEALADATGHSIEHLKPSDLTRPLQLSFLEDTYA
ncbi:MAG: hypothetical protein SGJ24_04560 [Chloroflexota bacterium]|nr:hypothetical protein [Chloroflexota bacterium]